MRHQLFPMKWGKKTLFADKRKEDNQGSYAEKKKRIADEEVLFSFSDLIPVSSISSPSTISSNFIFNQLSYFSTFFIWSLVQKRGFKLACNWFSNFKHLAIMSLQTRVKNLLTAGFPAFTLDIQMGISWTFDIKIKWFKSPNSSTRSGRQIWWKIRSEIRQIWWKIRSEIKSF